MDHSEFLRRIHGRLNGLRQAREMYAPRLAPDFNTFTFIAPDEMRLSEIIATLLYPPGDHAQGAAFLNAFLKRFALEAYLPEVSRDTKVRTEVVTDRIDSSMRRMDILIDFGQSAITIENKPWTYDQNEQVADYLKQLERSHPQKHCLLYLSGTGEPPSDDSIPQADRERFIEEGKLLVIAYTRLLDWLSDCKAICQAERVRHFLDDFSDYIRQQFMGVQDMTEFDQIFNAVTESGETLQMALQVASSVNEIKLKLLNQLEAQLGQKAKAKGWQFKRGIDYWSKYSGFDIFFFSEKQKYYVSFSFDGTECQGWYYGIAKKDEKLPDLPAIWRCLDSNIKTGKSGEWWPWYLYIDAPYLNWRDSHTPWMEIVDGCKLADMIIQKTEAIYEALAKNNLLDALRDK